LSSATNEASKGRLRRFPPGLRFLLLSCRAGAIRVPLVKFGLCSRPGVRSFGAGDPHGVSRFFERSLHALHVGLEALALCFGSEQPDRELLLLQLWRSVGVNRRTDAVESRLTGRSGATTKAPPRTRSSSGCGCTDPRSVG